MSEQQHNDHNVEQLHLSATVLVMKLAFWLFLLDTAFLLLLLGFILFGDYSELHHHYIVFLVIAHSVKYFFLTAIAVQLVSSWASRSIYISGHHLIIANGVANRNKKIYELQQLRTVEVRQDWLGQQLKYGNIALTFAASGFKQDVILPEMAHPRRCARIIEKHLGEEEK